MKAIVIPQHEFERLFSVMLERIELLKHRKLDQMGERHIQALEDLHRSVHFHLCEFKSELEKAR